MAANELLRHQLRDPRQVAGVPLLEQQRQEEDLKEDVAELVEELLVVTARRGVRELVGLLHGVGDDRALVLLSVPRALPAQAPGHGVEARERVELLPAHALLTARPGAAVPRPAARRRAEAAARRRARSHRAAAG